MLQKRATMICLTFDVEERFHSHLTPGDATREWNLRDRITILLDYLEEHKKKATFFVVGELAAEYPDLVRRMSAPNFEVASHSYSHIWMDTENRRQCRDDISDSKKALEDITGQPVYGFRAPSWSARISHDWLWDHLISLGFRYDASLFPFKTHMYGSFQNPVRPFRLHQQLIEIPPSVFAPGIVRIPYGGGFYFRLYPSWLTLFFIGRNLAEEKIPVIYLHPWDFEANPHMLERTWLQRFIGNYNIEKTWSRFTDLMDDYETITMSDFYRRLEPLL